MRSRAVPSRSLQILPRPIIHSRYITPFVLVTTMKLQLFSSRNEIRSFARCLARVAFLSALTLKIDPSVRDMLAESLYGEVTRVYEKWNSHSLGAPRVSSSVVLRFVLFVASLPFSSSSVPFLLFAGRSQKTHRRFRRNRPRRLMGDKRKMRRVVWAERGVMAEKRTLQRCNRCDRWIKNLSLSLSIIAISFLACNMYSSPASNSLQPVGFVNFVNAGYPAFSVLNERPRAR